MASSHSSSPVPQPNSSDAFFKKEKDVAKRFQPVQSLPDVCPKEPTGDPSSLCDSPSLVADQHRWTIYHSKVNLPAALNDPRLAKRESDFFTKTWGVDFVDTEVTPSFYLPQITKEHFALYQQEIAPREKVHERCKNICPSKDTFDRTLLHTYDKLKLLHQTSLQRRAAATGRPSLSALRIPEWLRWEVMCEDALVQTPCSSKVTEGTLSSLVLIISTDGGYATTLGSLFQCLATLRVKDEMFRVSVCTFCLLSYHWAYEESDFFTAVYQIFINITKQFELSELLLMQNTPWSLIQLCAVSAVTGQCVHIFPLLGPELAMVFQMLSHPCCLEGGLLSLGLQAVFFLMEPRMLGHKGALLAHGQFVDHQDLKGLLCRGDSLITFSKVLFGVCSCSKVEFLNFSEIVQLIRNQPKEGEKQRKKKM